MKVLVTGSAGFLGRTVVANLVDNGHRVIAGTRRLDRLAGVHAVSLDVTDKGSVWRAVLDSECEASQDTSRSPAWNAPAMPGVAWMPRSRANNAANGASPIRRRAYANPDDDGVTPVAALSWASSRQTPR
jgi:nucleoside-diphosphate-sugar epimerase